MNHVETLSSLRLGSEAKELFDEEERERERSEGEREITDLAQRATDEKH